MELITKSINIDLKFFIKKSFNSVKKIINKQNKRINHINIYHKDWKNNHCENIIKLLYYNYNIDKKTIISLGFINAQVECYNQHFHIDYNGTTETYFIPLVDLNDKNGTEYVEFNNLEQNINLFTELLEMSDKYISREQINNHFFDLGINKNDYKFKILNTPKYSMVKMPNFIYHRGKRNECNYNRTMFQIVIAKSDNINISSKIKVNDSELDEDDIIINKLLHSRLNNI